MVIREIMSGGVVSIAPEETVALAARLLARHNVGALPVCTAEGLLRGIVTDRDIVLRCVAAEEEPGQTLVKEVMSRSCVALSPEDDMREASRLMAARQVRRLPVVEEGRLVGMVSLGDLAACHSFDMEASKALSEISCPVNRSYL